MSRKTIPAHVEIRCDRCNATLTNSNRIIVHPRVSFDMPLGKTEEMDFCDPCMSVIDAGLHKLIDLHMNKIDPNKYET